MHQYTCLNETFINSCGDVAQNAAERNIQTAHHQMPISMNICIQTRLVVGFRRHRVP